jgi:hypothetical protein
MYTQGRDDSLVNGVHAVSGKEQESHIVREFHQIYVGVFCRNQKTADLQNKS